MQAAIFQTLILLSLFSFSFQETVFNFTGKCHQCNGLLGLCNGINDFGESVTCPEHVNGCLFYQDGNNFQNKSFKHNVQHFGFISRDWSYNKRLHVFRAQKYQNQ